MTRHPSPELEGHRVHLRALAHREQAAAYQRHDYLSREWQQDLWRDEVKGTRRPHTPEPGSSPSSVTVLADGGRAALPLAPSNIYAGWRERIIEWKYQVVDGFDLDREIVGISTYYLDQYLAMHYVDAELFQLVSMTCIHLAIKLHSPKKISMDFIVSLGNGPITAQDMEATELSIIKSLEWHLFPPTPIAFVENIFPLLALPPGDAVAEAMECARFLVELSVCAYPLARVRPSSVALAAVRYSLEACGHVPEKERRIVAAALRKLVHGSAGRDAAGPEVEACGGMLRRLHRIALRGEEG